MDSETAVYVGQCHCDWAHMDWVQTEKLNMFSGQIIEAAEQKTIYFAPFQEAFRAGMRSCFSEAQSAF